MTDPSSPNPSEAAVTEGPPLVLFDIDGVILGIDGTPLAGATALIDTLMCLGYEVHFWSAGGTMHVANALQRAGIYGGFTIHDKPTYPPSEAEALRIIGRRPALQIDDDPTERVADWAFMVWGYLRSQPSAPERPDLMNAIVKDVAQWRQEHPDLPWAPRAEHGAALRAERVEQPSLDVARVKQAVTNIAVRHRVVKDPPPPNWSLMSLYGYSAAPADMDAEIAAEYDRLSSSESARHG